MLCICYLTGVAKYFYQLLLLILVSIRDLNQSQFCLLFIYFYFSYHCLLKYVRWFSLAFFFISVAISPSLLLYDLFVSLYLKRIHTVSKIIIRKCQSDKFTPSAPRRKQNSQCSFRPLVLLFLPPRTFCASGIY